MVLLKISLISGSGPGLPEDACRNGGDVADRERPFESRVVLHALDTVDELQVQPGLAHSGQVIH